MAEHRAPVHIAHVLFLDLVGWSQGSLEEQTDSIAALNQVVRSTVTFAQAEAEGRLLCIPTGDGMALVFRGDFPSPLECALEVRAMSDANLRFGIHSGPVREERDLLGNPTVIGDGINMARRVLDAGQPGDITLSETYATWLQKSDRWASAIGPPVDTVVKHGVVLRLCRLLRVPDGLLEALEQRRKVAPVAIPESPPVSGPSSLPILSPHVVRRPDLEARIYAALEDSPNALAPRHATICDLGGAGKSTAALTYATSQTTRYPGGRFFLSMEHADFAERLAGLASALRIPAEGEVERIAGAVAARLAAVPSLLILDNVESADQWSAILRSGLLPAGECRVLVTTRDTRLSAGRVMSAGRLTSSEVRDVLRAFSVDRDPPEEDVATAIGDWLGGLAVAVAAVGARIRQRSHLGWSDYLQTLQGLRIDQLPDLHESVRRELGTDGAALDERRRTLHVVDEAYDALDPFAKSLLDLAALLPADLIPEPWLEALLRDDQDAPEPEPDDPTPAAIVKLYELRRLGIMRPASAIEADAPVHWSLHRLWRARIVERAAEQGRSLDRSWDAIAELARRRQETLVGPTGEAHRGVYEAAVISDATLRWELAPLVQTVVALAENGRLEAAAEVTTWITSPLRMLHRLQEARDTLVAVLDHPDAGDALDPLVRASLDSNLSLIHQADGRLDLALARIEDALELERRHLPADHIALATTYANLSNLLQDMDRHREALEHLERAIAIDRAVGEPAADALAIHLNNLSTLHRDMDRPDLGAQAAREALEVHSRLDAPVNRAIAQNNLAVCLFRLGDRAGALEGMQNALNLVTAHLGEDHPYADRMRSRLAEFSHDVP